MSIPGKGEIQFVVTVTPRLPGEFEAPMKVFLNDRGLSQVRISVRGVARHPPEPPGAD